jgi:hypothetical protein
MKKISINSSVKDGQLVANRKAITDAIKSFEGKNIIISIEKRKKKRSNNQNSFYWLVIDMMREGFNNTLGENVGVQEVHEFLKNRFLFKEIVNENIGEVVKMPKSTTELSTIEFEEYLDNIRSFGLEFLGITIPYPNDQVKLTF